LFIALGSSLAVPVNALAQPQSRQEAANQGLSLAPADTVLVSGFVGDGETGWPLYARITIDGYPDGPIFTNPITGLYSVNLEAGFETIFHVQSLVPGYLPEDRTVGPLSANQEQDFGLLVNSATCSAPGYHFESGLEENFEAGATPAGWTVIDNTEEGPWVFNNPGDRLNNTGGNGGFAIVDSDYYGPVDLDTELRTPSLDLSEQTSVILEFRHDFSHFGLEVGDVDVSIDGGSTWTNLASYSGADHQGAITIDASVEAAGEPVVMFRWHYYNANYDWWWQVDEVKVGSECVPTDGSLLVGNVYDGNTLLPLVGATVASDAGYPVTTVATPEDTNTDDGLYITFAPVGMHILTASFSSYNDDVEQVYAPSFYLAHQDFFLDAGLLTIAPVGLETTLLIGETDQQVLTLTNTGGREVNWGLTEIDPGMVPRTLGADDVPWLSEDPVSGVLPAFSSTQRGGHVEVTLPEGNGAGKSIEVSRIIPVPEGPRPNRARPERVLWNQDSALTSATLSQYMTDFSAGVFAADDFVSTEAWEIEQIGTTFFPFLGSGVFDSITFAIYPDASGVPAGYPGDGLPTATWTYTALPDDPALAITPDMITTDITFDIVAAEGAPLSVPAGHFWIVIFPQVEYQTEWWYWLTASTANLNEAQTIDTDDPAWTPAFGGDPQGHDLAFRLVGQPAGDAPQQDVTVTFDAGAVNQPGVYHAQIVVTQDTPYAATTIPVTMTVTASQNYGELEGTVISLGYCDRNLSPIQGAAVEITPVGGGTVTTLVTNSDGYYSTWLEEGDYTVHVTAANHETSDATVPIVDQTTTTQNFDLRMQVPCPGVDPESFSVEVVRGTSLTLPLMIMNEGAGELTVQITESLAPLVGSSENERIDTQPFIDIDWLSENPESGTVPADSSLAVDVTFSAFPTMTVGMSYEALLMIESNDAIGGQIVVPVVMTVIELAYGVEVSADDAITGLPGESVVYEVTITNTGEAEDSFDLALGVSSYVSTLNATSVGPLQPGESATVHVTVQIPGDALGGDSDAIILTAASQADSSKTDSATLTTTVGQTIITIYLPAVLN